MPLSGNSGRRTQRRRINVLSLWLVFLLAFLALSLSFNTQNMQASASDITDPAQEKLAATLAFKREYLGDICSPSAPMEQIRLIA